MTNERILFMNEKNKSLFIAEKPSVAMEFAKALGLNMSKRQDGYIEDGNYLITWCIGHLVTMSYPEKYDEDLKRWSFDTLPFIPTKYKYEIIPSVQKQYNVVSKLLNRKDVTKIYYSGDSAREGEYIQRLVREYGGHNPQAQEYRVWIDSQTRDEILKGIKNAKPLSEYDLLSDSAYARAIEDYLIGMNFSRALSVKYAQMVAHAAGMKYSPISVGRVMSCVLGMVVEREREIRTTKTFPYYGILAKLDEDIALDWKIDSMSPYMHSTKNYNNIGLTDKEPVLAMIANLNSIGKLHIDKIKTAQTHKSAPLLFNLAELQSECTKKFHISPSDTLKIAQKLYEEKLTTYPRTDARVLTTAVAKEYAKNINGLSGISMFREAATYVLKNNLHVTLATSKTKYINDALVSDHYAIIPTGDIAAYPKLSTLEHQVYELICRRFLSIFFPDAIYDNVSVYASADGLKFETKLIGLAVPGFLTIAGCDTKTVPAQIMEKAVNLSGTLPASYSLKEGKTKPPARYTTGSMILAMENAGNLIEEAELREQIKGSGIGTSATRADILSKLEKNQYISINKKNQIITPAMLGELVYDVLRESIPNILNPKYTASWEMGLSGIVEGKVSKDMYLAKINAYVKQGILSIKNTDYTEQIRTAINRLTEVYPNIKIVTSSHSSDAGRLCPICGKQMKTNIRSFFCSGYTDGCKFCVWKTLPNGKSIPENALEILLDVHRVDDHYESQETPLIKGLKSKSGKTFDAKLKMTYDSVNGSKMVYIFPQRK